MNHYVFELVRTVMPRRLQVQVRRWFVLRKLSRVSGIWPIQESAGAMPEGWPGWPQDKSFALVLTHDVDTARGLDRCRRLADLEEKHGFRSCFFFVPEKRYQVPSKILEELRQRGFEIGVHGLCHDWHTFRSRRIFEARAPKINSYLKDWGAVGFRAPSTVRNLDWIGELDIEYDSSAFDTDPFEPQSDGVSTVFPFRLPAEGRRRSYMELPYTLPQDFSLMVLMNERTNDIWKRKLDWLANLHGMALLDTHPDYMCFTGNPGREEYPVAVYEDFLRHVRDRYADTYWHALPREVARYGRKSAASVTRRLPRRVAMMAYAFYDTDNRIRRYAETLVRRGDEVDAIALRRPGRSRKGVVSGVHVLRVQMRQRDEKGQFSYAARMARFWVVSSAVLTVRHLCRPYDVVHVHSVPDFEVFAAWAAKLLGAKVILDIHDIVPEFYASKFGVKQGDWRFRFLMWLERVSTSFADHVIISNHLWHHRLTERAVPAEKCSAIPNYVDTHVFHPHPRTRNDGRLVVLYPGGLQRHQGLDVAIRAFGRVRREIPGAELHIYGEGPEKEKLADLVRELGLNGSVRLCESVDFSEMPSLMANADIGIVPKRAESFGNEAYSTKILEFMSQGLPVVLSRTKIDDYYFDEPTVRFFAPGDDSRLAEALVEVGRDPALRAAMSRASRDCAARNCWDTRKHEYLSIVDQLTGGSNGTPT
jgi:glycosyltransferase involved in cell wall biosynthesis/peptidoglycan/xylan/chitin deacetylase (PgdA/CDA1 family)